MYDMNPALLTDGYKLGHKPQYPKGTSWVMSNWTPRGSRYPNVNKVIVLGMQYFIKHFLIDGFNKFFFGKPKEEVCGEYAMYMRRYLGPDGVHVEHMEALHDLGYLPLRIRALPEGTSCPLRVAMATVENTLPDFYWLTNYIETLMSCVLWKPSTSATIAREFKRILEKWVNTTDPENAWFVDWQGHDFSFRGMSGVEAALTSGLGHATSFTGSDTFPVLWFADKYYNTTPDELVIGSVPATEHSVMCAGGKETEIETFRRLMEIYPKGILSVVSDTWDLWKVIEEVLPQLKDEILARDGKLVIRPDSGDPADILCGDPSAPVGSPARKGVIELLWDLFGGTMSVTGYKKLDSHVGTIYGDSITMERAENICYRLAQKGFASTNVVLGIGSFTFQFNTRDTFMFAMKATAATINGVFHELSKDPITDSGIKKSAAGRICVERATNGHLYMRDHCTEEQAEGGLLVTVFEDGLLFVEENLATIRERIAANV